MKREVPRNGMHCLYSAVTEFQDCNRMPSELPPAPSPFDPSLKKLPKACREWLTRESNDPAGDAAGIQELLDQDGILKAKIATRLKFIWHPYSMAACDAYFRSDARDLAKFLNWSIAFGSLFYRVRGMFAAASPEPEGKTFSPLWDSNRGAAPCMLHQWPVAEVCAQILIRDVENDLAFVADSKHRWYRHGTNDTFYAYFFADAFGRMRGLTKRWGMAPMPR